ncbi:MAG: ATP-dependent Clp protease ATP-binding subunit ClpA, partial [Myxococcaceae bacterium]|nr:ATP-dependent Clp protease ATP-binding subunit ClpA [Myxococcaceae bacterium]
MAAPIIAKELQQSFRQALDEARKRRHEYLTLEHLLFALTRESKAKELLAACGANVKRLAERLESFLEETVERLPEGTDAEPQQTIGVERVLHRAAIHAISADQKVIDAGDVLVALFREEESHALFLLQQEGVSRMDLLNYISHGITKDGSGEEPGESPSGEGMPAGEEEGPAPGKDPLKAFTTLLNQEAAEGRIDP